MESSDNSMCVLREEGKDGWGWKPIGALPPSEGGAAELLDVK